MTYVYGTGANANYSGRPLVYPDQVPYDSDILREAQYRMVDISNLAQSVLGLPTSIGGSYPELASGICTQNGAPNLTVNMGVCAIYTLQQLEPTTYGSIPALPLPLIYKQAINMVQTNSSTFGTITAPGTPGESQYYLICGEYDNAQINSVNRPYYNSVTPSNPTFASAADTEIDRITFSIVAGTAGVTPSIPSPTPGTVGMFTILVSYGQTQILNADIASYAPSSFPTLPSIPTNIQSSTYSYFNDLSGTPNVLVINPVPEVSAYANGLKFDVLAANTNTGITTLEVSGLGAIQVTYTNGNPLSGSEIIAGGIYTFQYAGSGFQILNPNVAQSFVPTGTVINFAAATAPAGYLVCDGSVVSQATYAALYAVIGSTWNTGGEGAGNFRLPNQARNVVMGAGGTGTGTIGNAVGNVGGAETHMLALNEMVQHTHNPSAGFTAFFGQGSGSAGTGLGGLQDMTITGGITSYVSQTAFNIVQPSMIMNMCIKT